jgi:macrolide phosphotransferase
MARSHLTLAALATAAVAGFDPVQARAFSTGVHGEYFAAVVRNSSGRELIVRAPNSAKAEYQLMTQEVALRAMTAGIRSRLACDVPTVAGRAPLGKTFGLVLEFLPGRAVTLSDIASNSPLPASIAGTLAAVHSLPTNFVSEAGLPVSSAEDVRSDVRALIDEARATGMLPALLVSRWQEAVAEDSLWMFEPTVIHGSVTADCFLAGQDSITGLLGWWGLAVGDPAQDLHWLINAEIAGQDLAFDAYATARASLADPRLRQRATLYSELELARWLLHGVSTQSPEIVDDAVTMLDRLLDHVTMTSTNRLGTETAPVLSVTEVVELLDETPGDAIPGDYRGLEPTADSQRSSSSVSE